MVEGDTLQSVAYAELGKPAYWRAIAELNGIDDPQRVEAGTTVLIPSAADAAQGS
jgi:nucleoid-associated protein YgaU